MTDTAVDDAARTQHSISILVIDDHPIVLDGVRMLVDTTPWISLLGYARTGRDGIALAEGCQPNVVLLDLRLPDVPGPEMVQAIRRVAPAAKIVLFTAHADHAGLQPAVDAGAHGVVLKDADRADLVDVIRRAAAGQRPGLSDDAHDNDERFRQKLREAGLTRREYEILRRVSMGETNPEIADHLGLSRNTVKTYVQTALYKLGARNRIEAVNRLNERGLL
jgi:two-component system, NarL family, nitrate/nitrite response regulator NarL